MEQNLQVGRQLDDKVLSNAIPDERSPEPGIDELRSIYPASEQHDRERPVILPRRPEKSLKFRMSSVHQLGPTTRCGVVSLGRVDELPRRNAKSPQGNLAQIEELKVGLEQDR